MLVQYDWLLVLSVSYLPKGPISGNLGGHTAVLPWNSIFCVRDDLLLARVTQENLVGYKTKLNSVALVRE